MVLSINSANVVQTHLKLVTTQIKTKFCTSDSIRYIYIQQKTYKTMDLGDTLLITNSKKAVKTVSFRKSSVLLGITLILIIFLSLHSIGNINASLPVDQSRTIDQVIPIEDRDDDKDGLTNGLENMLGTDNDSYYGDKDGDGLYDFEEYLDIYGSDDTTNQIYDYNDSMSGEDGVLDIYHLFGLSSNKTGYLRDINLFSQINGGFTDYLLWNVRFRTNSAGGGDASTGNVTYNNSVLRDVTFEATLAGGNIGNTLSYINNELTNVSFAGQYAGGSQNDGEVIYRGNILTNVSFTGQFAGANINGNVTYCDNIFTNVNFTGDYTGGSLGVSGGTENAVLYKNNTFTDVTFAGDYSGGSFSRDASFENNTFTNVEFSGDNSGGSNNGDLSYSNNKFTNVTFTGVNAGKSGAGSAEYEGNTVNNTFGGGSDDTDKDGLGDIFETFESGSDPTKNDTDEDGLNDSHEVWNLGTDPTLKDTDGDGLNDSYEVWNITTNATLKDTDGDGLDDGWELTYSGTSGIDPLIEATTAELASDGDNDRLSLAGEGKANTDPTSNDTDGDGLVDGWEVTYNGSMGVNPFVNATPDELVSDMDGDDLNLKEEEEANTNPALNDTDGDGLYDNYEVNTLMTDPTLKDTDGDSLNDGWEDTYKDAPGVNVTMNATESELISDTDGDGLTLLEEAGNNTDPTKKDTDGDSLADKWEVTYNGTSGVNPLVNATPTELTSDMDNDDLNLKEEEVAGTDPTKKDTDEDSLADKWEVTYNGTSGVNPLVKATPTELTSDMDNDDLTQAEEEAAGTDPTKKDTDEDGLGDKWEVTYNGTSGINPLVKATPTELTSDMDNDNLTQAEEERAGTDPTKNDTDGDTLNDKWEVTYKDASGVNPLVPATDAELASDQDKDGLTLLEEERGNTNPNNADNVMETTTMSVTESTNASTNISGETDDRGFPAVIVVSILVGILITIIVVVIIYRLIKRRGQNELRRRRF